MTLLKFKIFNHRSLCITRFFPNIYIPIMKLKNYLVKRLVHKNKTEHFQFRISTGLGTTATVTSSFTWQLIKTKQANLTFKLRLSSRQAESLRHWTENSVWDQNKRNKQQSNECKISSDGVLIGSGTLAGDLGRITIWNPWSNKSDANLKDSACTVRVLFFFPIVSKLVWTYFSKID